VILLDTCAIIHASLTAERLGKQAADTIAHGLRNRSLACSDISLWEISMLISRGRVKPDAESVSFIQHVVLAYSLAVLPITPHIAALSADDALFHHKDPCDRIIAATALHHTIPLVTSDSRLQGIPGLITIW
jgi:PIN domain nuclease of toxin-antitoxin system